MQENSVKREITFAFRVSADERRILEALGRVMERKDGDAARKIVLDAARAMGVMNNEGVRRESNP